MGLRLLRIISIALLTMAVCVPALNAADEKAPPGSAAQKEKRNRVPFRGKLSSVDKVAMTVTLEGKQKPRTLHVTSETRIMKAGKPATLGDAVVGEEVGGQAIKTAEGKEQVVSLRLGERPEPGPKKKKDKKNEQ